MYGLGKTGLRTQFWASYRQVRNVKLYLCTGYWVLVADDQGGRRYDSGKQAARHRTMGKPKSGLTAKQRHFALALGSGAGMTLSDAYREAYDCKNMSGAAIRNEASKLAANHDIAVMVERLRAENERAVSASLVNDREKVLQRLRQWMDDAEPTDTNKLKAAQLLGQTVGMFKDVVETNSGDRASTEVAAEIERRLATLQAAAEPKPKPDSLH